MKRWSELDFSTKTKLWEHIFCNFLSSHAVKIEVLDPSGNYQCPPPNTKGPHPAMTSPTILPLPYCVIYPQFLNASYGQSGICSEVPGLCGGNIIKVVKDVKGEEWGWHQANFTLGTRMVRSKPGLLPRNTDQSPLSTHQRRQKKKRQKDT